MTYKRERFEDRAPFESNREHRAKLGTFARREDRRAVKTAKTARRAGGHS